MLNIRALNQAAGQLLNIVWEAKPLYISGKDLL